jgi:hypothetical protein
MQKLEQPALIQQWYHRYLDNNLWSCGEGYVALTFLGRASPYYGFKTKSVVRQQEAGHTMVPYIELLFFKVAREPWVMCIRPSNFQEIVSNINHTGLG